MEIVVTDNMHWAREGAAFSDFRPYEYIITADKSFEGIIKDLANCRDIYEASEDLVYLINVHCIFSGGDAKTRVKDYYSDQNGVLIYRHLLSHYEKFQHNLKVAFFSPIPKEYLVKLRPENAVLEHHLVFQVPFNWETVVNNIREWNQNHRWRAFNNASENLLSGWALSGREKIATNGRQFVFVDDQCVEWETSIKEVVDDPGAFYFANYYKERHPPANFSPEKIYDRKRGDSSLFKTKVHQADLVLSDFYLQENHEIDTWKSYEELAEISGYRLFQFIRNELKVGAPIVMHTSSNKVRYYKFLDSKGIDDWLAKDIRIEPSHSEKQYNYQLFRKTIEKFAAGKHADVYRRLKTIWKRIQNLEARQQANWWLSDTEYPCAPSDGIKKLSRGEKEILIGLLTDCYFAIQGYLRHEDLFSNESQLKDRFGPSSISVNLGKIYELLQLPDLPKNQFMAFLREFRNVAAHYIPDQFISVEDAFLYFRYWLVALESDARTTREVFGSGPDWNFGDIRYTKFQILYLWILFHNSKARPGFGKKEFDEEIQNRASAILTSCDQAELYDELTADEQQFRSLKGRVTTGLKTKEVSSFNSFKVVLENDLLKLKPEYL